MIFTRILQAFVVTWIGLEVARPVFGLTQLLYAHELIVSAAGIAGGLVVSLAADEWVNG